MTLQNQVCSFGQSKRLNELGVEQLSIAHYDNEGELWLMPRTNADDIAAFTVAELGVMINVNAAGAPSIEIWNVEIDALVGLSVKNRNTEAECRAESLIKCLEMGTVKITEVNERLAS